MIRSIRPILIACLSLSLSVTLVACGGDDDSDDGGDDGGDDGAAVVTSVTCPATPDATFTAMTGTYSPTSASIGVGDIVLFDMPAAHNAASTTAGLFTAAFNAETCFKFDTAGTYTFRCTPHGFTGTVTVE